MSLQESGNPLTLINDLLTSNVHSFTKGETNEISVSNKYFNENDVVLIIDDFLANGQAALGLIDIVEQANANVAGIGIVIEKGFQDGGKQLREKGYSNRVPCDYIFIREWKSVF